MGSGASSLPAEIDEETAKSLAGDKFDKASFDAAATDGKIPRDAAVKMKEFLDALQIGMQTAAEKGIVEQPAAAEGGPNPSSVSGSFSASQAAVTDCQRGFFDVLADKMTREHGEQVAPDRGVGAAVTGTPLAEGKITVFVDAGLTGKPFVKVEMSPNDTVHDLSIRAAGATGAVMKILLQDGVELDLKRTLEASGIHDGDHVSAVTTHVVGECVQHDKAELTERAKSRMSQSQVEGVEVDHVKWFLDGVWDEPPHANPDDWGDDHECDPGYRDYMASSSQQSHAQHLRSAQEQFSKLPRTLHNLAGVAWANSGRTPNLRYDIYDLSMSMDEGITLVSFKFILHGMGVPDKYTAVPSPDQARLWDVSCESCKEFEEQVVKMTPSVWPEVGEQGEALDNGDVIVRESESLESAEICSLFQRNKFIIKEIGESGRAKVIVLRGGGWPSSGYDREGWANLKTDSGEPLVRKVVEPCSSHPYLQLSAKDRYQLYAGTMTFRVGSFTGPFLFGAGYGFGDTGFSLVRFPAMNRDA